MKVLLLDTETTGFNDARMIQLAYKDLHTGEIFDQKFKPPKKIEYGAMAVHHITNDDLEECEFFAQSNAKRNLEQLLKERCLVAHNAEFDINILKNEGVEVPYSICTKKVAYNYLDEQESYSLQFLRYACGLNDEKLAKMMPHDAYCDILVMEKLFNLLVAKTSFDSEKEMIADFMNITKKPQLLRRMPFGAKHKGKEFEKIAKEDKSYLQWLLRTNTKENPLNRDIEYTVRYYLQLYK